MHVLLVGNAAPWLARRSRRDAEEPRAYLGVSSLDYFCWRLASGSAFDDGTGFPGISEGQHGSVMASSMALTARKASRLAEYPTRSRGSASEAGDGSGRRQLGSLARLRASRIISNLGSDHPSGRFRGNPMRCFRSEIACERLLHRAPLAGALVHLWPLAVLFRRRPVVA